MAADLHDTYFIGCLPKTMAVRPAAEPGPRTMGFKAWNLLRMADMGLPVPPAFVLGTGWCHDVASRAAAAQPSTWQTALTALASRTGLLLGHARRPLLLSVRSGAPVSMPGMMETLLNIGLCDATVPGLLR
jgi:pyruvate,orthophosphate dikinase